jgi:hypothetical protein
MTDDYVSLEGLAWNRRTGEVWFAAASGAGWANGFFAVSQSGVIREIAKYPAGVRLFDVAPDGRVLFTTEDWSSRVTGYFPGDPAEHDYSWLDATLVTDISDNGKLLLFWEGGAATSTGMVYLRKTDGSPAVRLGDGMALSLSPDGNWVLATSSLAGTDLRLLPTGPGEPVPLPALDITARAVTTWWSTDSMRFAYAGFGADRKLRLYLRTRGGGTPVPVTGELRDTYFAMATDGTLAALPADADRIHAFSATGSDLGAVPGAAPGEVPVRFAADGRLVVHTISQLPMPVYLIDTHTGKRTLWKTLGPSSRDIFDQQRVEWFVVTPDLKYYAYTHGESLSQLYVAQNLR